jgi:L-serine dehydratase
MFVAALTARDGLGRVADVRVDLYGSLAATGAGHGTMPAILLGLEGYQPDTIETDEMERRLAAVRRDGKIRLGGRIALALSESDIFLHPSRRLEHHPNGMALTATSEFGDVVYQETYFSVGGGFVVTGSESTAGGAQRSGADSPFQSAGQLLELTEREGIAISQAMMRHECATRSEAEVRDRLVQIREVMVACQNNGMSRDGLLPGNLRVRRRAKDWFVRLAAEDPHHDPAFAEDWVNLIALAVNEENASGGRVVTAPTNGAAGIVPAVLYYALHYTPAGRRDSDDATVRFLLTAGAIGSLYKLRASISGAEVGCQGEVGSAASMAAGALAEILGGTPQQVENAAEIAMEHSLGLTCDPIGGLVQIPCIERNAISAGKAINAARMALRGDGSHRVSLDQVIDTMWATGLDMNAKYKETSTGGLAIAVNVVEC